MHRFTWNLRYDRPDAISYDYSIAAIWGRGVPLDPRGPFALPGTYTVTLTVGEAKFTAPLTIAEDPRIHTNAPNLAASLAVSQKIADALSQAAAGYREQTAIRKILETRFPKSGKTDPALLALCVPLRAKPATGQITFESVAGMLTNVENALESADVAPTQVQQSFVADALVKLETVKHGWAAAKSGPLAELNAALARKGQEPVVVTPAELREVEEPDTGQDLP
jgi:hypothetical protein